MKEEALNNDILAPKAAGGPGKAEKKQVSSTAPLNVYHWVCMRLLYRDICFCTSAGASMCTEKLHLSKI